MDLNKLIKTAIKDKKLTIGYKKVINELKTGKLGYVIYANNTPQEKLDNITHNIKLTGTDLIEYSGDNVNLGLMCGKPFSVSVLGIKGSEK